MTLTLSFVEFLVSVDDRSDVLWLRLQLAEIAIPHLLAASIFSAQNGGAVFYRNAKLLVVLCLVSGVFRLVIFCSDCAHSVHFCNFLYKIIHNLADCSHLIAEHRHCCL